MHMLLLAMPLLLTSRKGEKKREKRKAIPDPKQDAGSGSDQRAGQKSDALSGGFGFRLQSGT